MVENKLFRYNRMFFIVSLGVDDTPSFDVEDYVNNTLKMGPSFCETIVVKNVKEWNEAFERLIIESSPESIPILFVECHGDRSGNLVLGGNNSREKVRMKDFLDQINAIKEKADEKILLATAICHGLNFFRKMNKLDNSIPCSCIIGSYTMQSSIDIKERYKLFFKTLLSPNNIGSVKSAFSKMKNAYRNNSILKEWAKGKRYGMLTNKRSYLLPRE